MRDFAVLLSLLSSCFLGWAESPDLVRFAPPDSGVLIGVNLEQIRSSDLGKSLLAKANLESAGLQKFIAMSGFNPLRDIGEILISAPAKGQKGRGLFLLSGSFDPTRFAELAVQPGMSASTWRGVQIITKKQEQPLSLACLNSTIVVGGDPESVRTAIARRSNGGGPDPELAAKAAEMRAANDIWLVSRVSPADLTDKVPAGAVAGNPQLELLRSVEQASGGMKFGPDLLLTADLTAHTPKDAETIASTMRLFIGLAASSQRDAKQAGAILEKLALRAEGNSVKLSFSIPQAELTKSIESAMTRAAQVRLPEPPRPEPTGVTIYSSPKDMGVKELPPQK